MRWCFIFLVFVNCFFYIWQNQQTTITHTQTLNDTNKLNNDQVQTIILLREQPEAAIEKNKNTITTDNIDKTETSDSEQPSVTP